ncbi:hypothetical protein PFDG_00193 [Plasmodium falciparum Dd2]|uniref:Rifin n=1 Tax=Plasmodium falciparum (isolate Dd2) TaxID=57267 RepID=A0A0L7LW82_PLAF4|nr:hypothetical protein PFDG_00193 [Plasmodium falciparum Dd2]
MKEVMQDFYRQTSQRLREYNERMSKNRQKCKEQCEKDIQKIILKDKIEKELTEKFSTLETNIDANDIPTCICEKSVVDKVEKGCLKCGYGLGSVAPSVGLFGALAVYQWKTGAMAAAAQKGIDAGIAKAIKGLEEIYGLSQFSYLDWHAMVTATTYYQPMELVKIVNSINSMCTESNPAFDSLFCTASYSINSGGTSSSFTQTISPLAAKAAGAAGEAAKAAELVEAAKFVPKTTILTNTIIASIGVIVVIILLMVIIYLILRYRRKKKMKKKLQYIKLLKE